MASLKIPLIVTDFHFSSVFCLFFSCFYFSLIVMSSYIHIFLSSSVLPFLFLFLKSIVLSVSLYSLEIMNFSCHPESALKKKNMNPVFMEVDLIRICSPCCL